MCVFFQIFDFRRYPSPDPENPASVQAMLADIFVDNCGHFYEGQKRTKILSNCGSHLDKLFIFFNKCVDILLILIEYLTFVGI